MNVLEGRNVFNLAENPNATEDVDYEYYCPIKIDEQDRVNKNQPDYFLVMKKCLLEDPECRQNRTLEEILSSEQEGNFKNLIIFTFPESSNYYA